MIKQVLKNFFSAAIILIPVFSASVHADDNDDLELAIAALIFTHNAALPISLAPGFTFGVSEAASLVTFGTNLGLKYVPPLLVQPADKFLEPTSSDMCEVKFTLPQTSADYANLFGFWDTNPVPEDWGVLGQPVVYHANTSASVKVESFDIARQKSEPQFVFLDAGSHSFQWSATSEVDVLFDGVLPLAVFGYDLIRWGKLFTKFGATGAKATQAAKILDNESYKFIFALALELGLTTAGEFSKLGKPTNSNDGPERIQRLTVYDVLDPVISTETEIFNAEATDIGGAFYARFASELASTINAYDPCGRDFTLSNDAPVLLPLGESVITWTVTDQGPNRNLTSNKATLLQRINVQDTQAPILVPPPGKVIESSAASLNVDEIEFGSPRVVDLADSSVSVSSDAPESFLRDSRTTVTWSATDDSGNTAMASQLITVKEIGTNSAPSAIPMIASTLSSEPVDIILRGTDPDIIDGVADPLAFDIQSFPQDGDFVSPLLPYFINDYRTAPEGPWGEAFRTASNRSNWVGENICENENTVLPKDFVYNPKFFQVTDDGTQFITDYYWSCSFSSKSRTDRRISKWDSDGNFLGSHSLGNNSHDEFVLDRDGFLYKLSTVGAGSSTDLFLTRCSTDFGLKSGGEICDASWKFNYASAPNLDNRNLIYARVDSSQGIAFVLDKRNIYLFDIRGEQSQGAQYLGKMFDGFDMYNCASKNMQLEVDADGYLYANNACSDRITKYSPSFFDSNDNFVMGEEIGWLGRCDSSTNKSCDETSGISKGFSCTDDTCSVVTTEGDEPGQFNNPGHIVMDPNNILYVADTGNSRIQRFSQDGTFVGEAKSTGTGINKGDSPSFILGNFAQPKAVTVNSKHFYILDIDESFVHVFETSPLKDITENSATVTYVSDFAFHSSTDQFTYRVNDGLDNSADVTVSINVARNFRQPEAISQKLFMDEDGVLEFALQGDDPDGILGEDFNGLDTLSYDLITGPEHGRLEGSGKNRRYTPDDDFYGTEILSFTVNDGREDAEPAFVEIEVLPVNDAPKLTLVLQDNIAAGFPAGLTINFTDDNLHPELEEQHQVRIDWGDGAVDVNGELTEDSLNGVMVISPVAEGVSGVAVAQNTYRFADTHTLRACITDSEGAQGCSETQVTVKELVKTSLNLQQSSEIVDVDGANIYTVEVQNEQPDSPIAGLSAKETLVSIVLPEGMTSGRVSLEHNCQANLREVFCELGDLEPGQNEQINIEGINDGSSLFDREGVFSVMVESTTPATQKFFAGLLQTNLSVNAQDSDGDGMTDQYEIAMGLNPEVDDSEEDFDGDGLKNIEEYDLFLFANTNDTDMDGVDDIWELKYGLDPTYLLDAGRDDDGDGFSNRQEYLADRNPNVDENTGTELVNVTAQFDDEKLILPTIKIGKRFFDIELTVTQMEPLQFKISDYVRRDIKIAVDDHSTFNPATSLVDIPALQYEDKEYRVGLLLTGTSPLRLEVVSGLPL